MNGIQILLMFYLCREKPIYSDKNISCFCYKKKGFYNTIRKTTNDPLVVQPEIQ